MALCLLGIGLAFFPTLYRDDTFPVSSGLLPQAYQVAVRHPAFGPADAVTDVSISLQPEGEGSAQSTSGDVYGVILAEPQSASVRFDPAGKFQTPLVAGRPVRFSWKASATQAGAHSFSLFLFLQKDPQAPEATGLQPFWAHSFDWQTLPDYSSWRIPILFTAAFGFLAGLVLMLSSAIR